MFPLAQMYAKLCLPVLDSATRYGGATDACLPVIVRTLCRLLVVDYSDTWPIVRNLLMDDSIGPRCFLLLIELVESSTYDRQNRCVGESHPTLIGTAPRSRRLLCARVFACERGCSSTGNCKVRCLL